MTQHITFLSSTDSRSSGEINTMIVRALILLRLTFRWPERPTSSEHKRNEFSAN